MRSHHQSDVPIRSSGTKSDQERCMELECDDRAADRSVTRTRATAKSAHRRRTWISPRFSSYFSSLFCWAAAGSAVVAGTETHPLNTIAVLVLSFGQPRREPIFLSTGK